MLSTTIRRIVRTGAIPPGHIPRDVRIEGVLKLITGFPGGDTLKLIVEVLDDYEATLPIIATLTRQAAADLLVERSNDPGERSVGGTSLRGVGATGFDGFPGPVRGDDHSEDDRYGDTAEPEYQPEP